MDKIIVYKIQRKSDGLYSNGGSDPLFMKKGKIWRGLGDLKNHFNIIRECHKSEKYLENLYKNCEIVTFILNPVETIYVEKFLNSPKVLNTYTRN